MVIATKSQKTLALANKYIKCREETWETGGSNGRYKKTYLNTRTKQCKSGNASMNAGALRPKASLGRPAQLLQDQKIDIARIQETHNGGNGAVASAIYTIVFGRNGKSNEPTLK